MSKPDEATPRAKYGISDPYLEKTADTESFAKLPANRRHLELKTYDAFPSELSKQIEAEAPARRRLAPGEIEKRAIWIVHGMGQQIPFATVDSLTEGILRVAKLPHGAQDFEPKAASIRVGDQILQRVELKVRSADDTKDVELHLYEAYWAPLTEGVAKLKDVVGFLLNGSIRGLLNSVKPFKRAMFAHICEFRIRARVPLYILSILILLGSLAFINAMVLAASANQLKLFGEALKPLAVYWTTLTALGSSLSSIGITLGAILFVAELWKPLPPAGDKVAVHERLCEDYLRNKRLARISWTGTILAAIGISVTAALSLLTVAAPRLPSLVRGIASAEVCRLTGSATLLQFASTILILTSVLVIVLAMLTRGKNKSQFKRIASNGFLQFLLGATLFLEIIAVVILILACFGWHIPQRDWPRAVHFIWDFFKNPWWVWPFLIFFSSQVRTIMVEYPGDVAIYITSNKIDRFDAARQKIKDVAYKSANSVFLAKADGGNFFEYEKIAIIGHSLGSVIAYDTLNRMINDDRLTGGKLRIVERTCLFETFGSPLNKIAFFFTIQGKDAFQMREQLAESVQPLIMDYRYRPFPWVNVHSKSDIISGDVYFYDWPAPDDPLATPPNQVPAPGASSAGPPAKVPLPPGYHAVIDKIDPNATVALAAHVDYWKNRLVWEELYEHATK